MRRVLWALLLCHAIGGMASAQDMSSMSGAVTPRLRVDVVFDGPPMPPKLEASVTEEATGIWAAYGVDVHRSGACDVGGNSAVRLAVMLVDRPDRRTAKAALGSILFVDDVPKPTILMYRSAIAALLSTVRLNGNSDREWPTALHDLLLGRVLGRALAHEIGHFLLQSRDHAETGLMRARQWTTDLVSPDRRGFGLSAGEVARLTAITSAAFHSAPAVGLPGDTASR
jgi:hypothetical protein